MTTPADNLRDLIITALENAHRTHPCPVTGSKYWTGCYHADGTGATCHSERRADAVLAVLPDARQVVGTPTTDSGTPMPTAPSAAGFPLVRGLCPACGAASLFLGVGGYPTCSRTDCPAPDAASTVLEQPASAPAAPADRSDVGTEFVRQADQPDTAALRPGHSSPGGRRRAA